MIDSTATKIIQPSSTGEYGILLGIIGVLILMAFVLLLNPVIIPLLKSKFKLSPKGEKDEPAEASTDNHICHQSGNILGMEKRMENVERAVIEGFKAVESRFVALETAQKIAVKEAEKQQESIEHLTEIVSGVRQGMGELKGLIEGVLRAKGLG